MKAKLWSPQQMLSEDLDLPLPLCCHPKHKVQCSSPWRFSVAPSGPPPAAPHPFDIGDLKEEAAPQVRSHESRAEGKNPPSPCCPDYGGVWGCWPNICSPTAASTALLEVQLSVPLSFQTPFPTYNSEHTFS